MKRALLSFAIAAALLHAAPARQAEGPPVTCCQASAMPGVADTPSFWGSLWFALTSWPW
jgi:hypothetical protein